MSKKKVVETKPEEKSIDVPVKPEPGIMKRYTQNGIRFVRVRKENGEIVDERE